MTGVPTIRDIGERELLARILKLLPTGQALLGPGDDAAVLAAPDARSVISTDTLIEGPDFRLDWSTPEQLGYKSVVVNLADIAAMGATPTGIVAALAAPSDTDVEVIEGLARGMARAFVDHAPSAGVIGGDLGTANQMVIAITAFGDLDGGAPVTRAGARVGDIIAIAGSMGRAAAGLQLCWQGSMHRDLATLTPAQRALVDAQLAPNPPIQAGVMARIHGATAMMDVSDGLLLDAHRLAVASGVQLNLEPQHWRDRTEQLAADLGVPVDQALTLELTGGEDHALLATFPAGTRLPAPFIQIGQVGEASADAPAAVTVNGHVEPPTGWDPFAD